MKPTEQFAKSAPAPKTGLSVALRGLLRANGSGARSSRGVLVTLSVLAVAIGVLAAVAAPTLAAAAPEAYATNVASSSATLNGVLDPEGSTVSYRFEYGTSTAYGSQTQEAGASLANVEAHIQGLDSATLYHYRLVVTNAAQETFESEDHVFTTQHTADGFVLPDGRQDEMVTPPQKEGALFVPLEPKTNVVMQASVHGDAIADVASRPTEAGAKGYDEEVAVLSTRGSGGWSSQDLGGEHDELGSLILGEGNEFRFFSEDISRAVTQQLGEFAALSPEASEPTPYLRSNYLDGDVNDHCEGSYLTTNSCFQPLVTRANTLEGVVFGEVSNGVCPRFFCGPHFVDGTPDLSHIILSSSYVLTPNAVSDENGKYDYEWADGRLQPLPGAFVLGSRDDELSDRVGGSHAISTDGERVILERKDLEPELEQDESLELFDATKDEVVSLTTPEPGCGTCDGNGVVRFQTANGEDSRIFFLDSAPLTAEHSATGEDLYECEIVEVAGKLKCDLSNLTPSVGASETLGASEDGAYVYFAAGGGLAPGSVQGTCNNGESTEECDVYVRHNGVTRLVAPSWIAGSPPTELSRVSPDGRWLAFTSRRSLTGYDNHDAASGQPDTEVYLYHAETSPSGALEPGKLVCASCDPTGARPVGVKPRSEEDWVAGEVPARETYGSQGDITIYQSRYLSDSGRLFFDSNDALVTQDVNGAKDVYEYEPEGVPAGEHACSESSTSGSEIFKPAHAVEVGGVTGEEGAGCVALISSGTSSEPSSFIDASETGADVFFITTSKLAPQDFDTAPDVYDAHECTSGSPCATSVVVPPPCTTEASCKPPPTPQPSIYGLPSSATFSGPGDLTPPPAPRPAKKVTKKTVKCKKGFAKNKKGKCVKTKKRKKAKKAGNHRRTK